MGIDHLKSMETNLREMVMKTWTASK